MHFIFGFVFGLLFCGHFEFLSLSILTIITFHFEFSVFWVEFGDLGKINMGIRIINVISSSLSYHTLHQEPSLLIIGFYIS
ncbi:hypothetical protein Hanom_Chr16g01455131 [Helianthus anomalus]